MPLTRLVMVEVKVVENMLHARKWSGFTCKKLSEYCIELASLKKKKGEK